MLASEYLGELARLEGSVSFRTLIADDLNSVYIMRLETRHAVISRRLQDMTDWGPTIKEALEALRKAGI